MKYAPRSLIGESSCPSTSNVVPRWAVMGASPVAPPTASTPGSAAILSSTAAAVVARAPGVG